MTLGWARQDVRMADVGNPWETTTYGDPCRQCAFFHTITREAAVSVVVAIPDSLTELLSGKTGDERHRDLAWPVSAYVCHVGDNLRIWAERLAGVAQGGPREIGGYDENMLATARNYERIPLAAALWSVRRAVADWREAIQQASRMDVVLVHPERGELSVLDVVRSNAHDSTHHQWDIRRSLEPPVQ
jgi:hypothetical protein